MACPPLSRISATEGLTTTGPSSARPASSITDWLGQQSSSARGTRSVTGMLVDSSSSGQTWARKQPAASASDQPVRRSAAGFIESMRPQTSVVTTASPIARSVTWARSFSANSCASKRLRSEISLREPAIRTALPTGLRTMRPRARTHR
ncbi:hypothetical protein D3C87_1461080 [compost metagenome]